MRIRSFVIAYSLLLARLLFADRRPVSPQQDRYSHIVDLTDGQDALTPRATATESKTRIIAPGELIPGTWTAGQIPAERLVAPLVVMDLTSDNPRISLDDIAAWESRHGMIPQGAVVAMRRGVTRNRRDTGRAEASTGDSKTNDLLAANASSISNTSLSLDRDAVMFLIEARNAIGFAVETQVNLTSDRTLARQLALHGSYVLERTAPPHRVARNWLAHHRRTG